MTIFKTFSCVTFYDGEGGAESFLQEDMAISCDGLRYQFAYSYAVAMVLIFPIGVPITGRFVVPHFTLSYYLTVQFFN